MKQNNTFLKYTFFACFIINIKVTMYKIQISSAKTGGLVQLCQGVDDSSYIRVD